MKRGGFLILLSGSLELRTFLKGTILEDYINRGEDVFLISALGSWLCFGRAIIAFNVGFIRFCSSMKPLLPSCHVIIEPGAYVITDIEGVKANMSQFYLLVTMFLEIRNDRVNLVKMLGANCLLATGIQKMQVGSHSKLLLSSSHVPDSIVPGASLFIGQTHSGCASSRFDACSAICIACHHVISDSFLSRSIMMAWSFGTWNVGPSHQSFQGWKAFLNDIKEAPMSYCVGSILVLFETEAKQAAQPSGLLVSPQVPNPRESFPVKITRVRNCSNVRVSMSRSLLQKTRRCPCELSGELDTPMVEEKPCEPYV
ncbi:hypothetical protein VNO77_39027 [Canavalia gladiata]|uniref:Uncharacterized protein n=1 Tax=Canavalia gladiata TaxID=3824 RepID=A0AAN9K9P4_CANGL